jgi:hypothetical protein
MAGEKCEGGLPFLFITFGALCDPSLAASPDPDECGTNHLVITWEREHQCEAAEAWAAR